MQASGLARRRRVASLVAASSVWLLASAANAGDPAAAESLFREAQALMDKGDLAAACPKLEESQRLDPTGATALSLGSCLEAQGKIASAWARYEEALGFARKKGAKAREKELEARIATIAKDVPRLTIAVSTRAARLGDLEVRRDDVVVGRAQWDSSVAVDPGTLRITARAAGHRAFATDVVVGRGERARVEIPELERDAEIAATSASSPAAAPVVTAPPPSAAGSAATSPPGPPAQARRQPLAYASLGAGLVTFGVGTYFALRWSSLSREARSLCDSPRCGDEAHASAVAKAGDAGSAAWLAWGSFAASAVFGGLSAYLFLGDRAETVAVAPWVSPGFVGGSVARRF